MLSLTACSIVGLAWLGGLASALGVDWVSVYIYAADTKAPVRADAEGTYTVAKQLTDHDEKDAESFQFTNGGEGIAIFSNLYHGFASVDADAATLQGQYIRNSSRPFRYVLEDVDSGKGVFKIKALKEDLYWTSTSISINATHNLITLQPPNNSPTQLWTSTHKLRAFDAQFAGDLVKAFAGELKDAEHVDWKKMVSQRARKQRRRVLDS